MKGNRALAPFKSVKKVKKERLSAPKRGKGLF